jgi:hypothetical protein
MIRGLERRAAKAGLAGRIEARLAAPESLGIGDLAEKAGFALAFAVAHEMPDLAVFFRELREALAPAGRILLAEPSMHVSRREFARTVEVAEEAGLRQAGAVSIMASRSVLLASAGS